MESKLILGDCLEELGKLDGNSIDLIITSPPYEDVSGAGYAAQTKDILFLKLYSEFMDGVFKQYARILKDGGQLFFNIKSKTHNKLLKTAHWLEFTSGFQLLDFKSFIIWKYSGSFDSTKKRFHLDYEIVYHLSKGPDIYLNEDCGIHDPLSSVWHIPHAIPKKERVHPTQMTGDIVLDNFMGSGTTGVVCKKEGLDFIGMEINPKHFETAQNRINKTSSLAKFL